MSEELEVLSKVPHFDNAGGLTNVYCEKLLVRYKGSEIKDPAVCAPAIFEDIERIKKFEVHEDDVFLCGFPRSGTTFMQEMIWLILHDFDFEAAEEIDAYNRSQWFDYFAVTHTLQGVDDDNFEKLERPRVFKTHFPVQFLPPQIWTKNAKVVYISREVKDVAVSGYYYRKTILHERLGSIEEHFDDFMKDQVFFGPYREYHKNYVALNEKPNVISLTYEGVLADWEGSIRKVAEFLGKEASDENVKKLVAYLDFNAMKNNPNTNMVQYLELFNVLAGHDEPTDMFIRKGKVGGYKDEMSEEYARKFDDWMSEKSIQ